MTIKKSQQFFETAKEIIPGGVNSPVRAFGGVGGTPIFFEKAQGAYLWDVDNNRYIDYVGSWGPAILGHAHPDVVEAVQEQLPKGLTFGAPTELETQLAQMVQRFMPSMEMMRMVSSGTEATLSAIRLARGYTKRNKILKFEGCYHGHGDSLLVKAGSGLLTFNIASSAGVPASFVEHTLTAPYNDIEAVELIFKNFGDDLAAVIIEPIAGNMNLVPATQDFINKLRQLCDQYQSLLIFDEVMCGFRVAKGGAQALFNIKPDLTTLGKVIGGGMPVGAYGGRREIMEQLAPLGPVYQAGTLSGNPLAMVAGLATLSIIDTQANFYPHLFARTQQLAEGLNQIGEKLSIPFYAQSVGSMFGLYFNDKKHLQNYQEMATCDIAAFKKFFHHMLENGVYLAPSAFEAGFVSIMHTEADIDQTLAIAEKCLSIAR